MGGSKLRHACCCVCVGAGSTAAKASSSLAALADWGWASHRFILPFAVTADGARSALSSSGHQPKHDGVAVWSKGESRAPRGGGRNSCGSASLRYRNIACLPGKESVMFGGQPFFRAGSVPLQLGCWKLLLTRRKSGAPSHRNHTLCKELWC